MLTTNIGKMENEGVELSINAVPIDTKDWKWTIGFNYTWNDSKITKLNLIDTGQNFVQTGAISGTGKYVQEPDGSVSSTETRYATGKSALPTSYMGFNTHLSYKNWDLAVSGHGSFGNYVYNYVAADQYVQSVYSDQGSYSNILQATAKSGFQQQQLYSDKWLEDGSFFRFDNITLGYTFDKLWNDSSKLRLSFTMTNIATITGYSGIDPELTDGIDRDMYPRPRSYTLGVNLTF